MGLKKILAICVALTTIGSLRPPLASSQEAGAVTLASLRPECGTPCGRHALIFVHGLWGANTTWLNEQSRRSWPNLTATDQFFKEFDIYVVNYLTELRAARQPRLEDVVGELYELMRSREMHRYTSIHFIGHSLGGTVIQRYLLLIKLKTSKAHPLLTKYRSIILLGTPSAGSDLARLGGLFSNDPKVQTLLPIEKNEYLYALKKDWEAMEEKRRNEEYPHVVVSVGYEEERYLGMIVVSKESAAVFADPGRLQGFRRDHVSLAKPRDHNDQVYVWVRTQIRDGLSR